MPEEAVSAPLRLAIRNDYVVVVLGIAAMLAPYADQVEIVEVAVGDGGQRTPVDITLYDAFSQTQIDGSDVDELLNDPAAGKVVVLTWNVNPSLVRMARDKGVSGYLSKTLDGAGLVSALTRVHQGEVVITEQTTRSSNVNGQWPGREHGLTAREAEVVSLVTQGLSNEAIARQSYISINSVKSYIRTAYRKMGVTTRAQAVLWGVQHGLLPDRGRLAPDGD
ncbi:LuxR family two component transcriptional regulator [Branchiibius hedensis]|uniref:DNA-binding response regulator, NarL/FixJ family, contains REC and HTH domains n=1 Tax=Branchiibius hedensis TaxID=672460 RepID=A0A2Y9C299_9MICO|nr:response regulator transcription factor [Branchiibius hedensis]PWJ26922.1 LuxR family two component transcriptional regulator [Branchiibius hedensis]SSA35733.1 DNA-binding response regulator, NarL/FixJ family, contains REC and HTH domains [Branchiibius hedensis]